MQRILAQTIAVWIKRCVFCLLVTFALASAVWAQAQIT